MKIAQRLALATVVMTLFLVAVGVYVRATGSGLGCPDWPTCYGDIVPPDQYHAYIEMSHRYTASVVGLMVIAVAWLAWKHYRHSPFVLWTAIATVPLVGFQGILGAITVVRELPPEIVATHLLTAMIVLSFQVAVAIGMYLDDPDTTWPSFTTGPARRIGAIGLAATIWLAITLWIGGYMAESGAATACADWPFCNGGPFPANDDHEITHMVHRYLAGALLFFIVPFTIAAWRARHEVFWAAPVAIAAPVLYAVQVLVGALNVWYVFPDLLTVSHTAIASAVWVTLSVAVVFAYYKPVVSRAGYRASRRLGVTA
ncbi:MAG: COX15/CtaA family protein [Dehalococcoidia bacterium]|nr:COX15/CtaA family protein [Dehalococcoidia bacterium]